MSDNDRMGEWLGLEELPYWAEKGDQYSKKLSDGELEVLNKLGRQAQVTIEVLVDKLVEVGEIDPSREDEYLQSGTGHVAKAISAAFGFGYEKGTNAR